MIKIRSAQKTDLKAGEDLLKIPELAMADGNYINSNILQEHLDEKYFLIAEEDRKILGIIFGEPLRCHDVMIWEFVISKSKRNKGIGSALLKKFEKNAVEDNKKWSILYAPAKSSRTLEFYKKRNYSKGILNFEHRKILSEYFT